MDLFEKEVPAQLPAGLGADFFDHFAAVTDDNTPLCFAGDKDERTDTDQVIRFPKLLHFDLYRVRHFLFVVEGGSACG